MVIAVFIFEKKGEIRMRTKVYGEELTAETLENVTGVILYLDLKPYLNDWVGTNGG